MTLYLLTLFQLYASSEPDLQHWLQALRQTVDSMKNGGTGGGGESQEGGGAGGAAGGGAAGGGSSPVTTRPESVKCVRNVKLDQMQERENDTKNAMMLADDQLKQAREAREGEAGATLYSTMLN